MTRARRFLRDNAETVVFASSLVVLAALLAWWAIFARRLIAAHELLSAIHAKSTAVDEADLVQKLDEITRTGDRQTLMITGEGALFGAMLLTLLFVLFMVAVRRRDAKTRLERLLQFTTHELKTPIAGVRALFQSLQLGSIPESERARFLDQGLLEMNRLEHLAETILAYQRATSKAKREPMQARTEELIAEILEHRRRTFGEEKLERGAAHDAGVLVDRDAFRVVLENLLDNARKYGGGSVRMREVVDNTRARWRLSVEDDGIGFDPKDKEILFDPFERTEGAGAAHGSGLGLYISRQLARNMGGDLVAESAGKGKGSTFTFEVPLHGG
jgi:signal transduction histidine kinase